MPAKMRSAMAEGPKESPRFSIVVPTRDRAETLELALRTCLEQDFKSYEVIVSDNGRLESTRQLIDRIASERIRYVHTPRPMAMSDSWEFALGHASGEYVILIGDDDGLLPHALRDIDRILASVHAPLLRWQYVYYMWPNVVFPDVTNRISIPLKRDLEWLSSREVIVGVANSVLDPAMLPTIYHGVIHRDLINELRKRAGRVFGGFAPDVYSGFAFAYLSKKYPSVTAPMSIAGLSGASNGSEVAAAGSWNAPIGKDFRTLNAEAGLGPHPKAPHLSCLPAIVVDMYFRARDALFPSDGSVSPSLRLVAQSCMRSLSWETPGQWREGFEEVRGRLLSNSPHLQKWFDRAFKEVPAACTAFRSFYIPWGFHNDRLVVDASDFGVSDVYGAAQLTEKILAQRHHDFGVPELRQPMGAYRRARSVARILLKGR